METGRPFRMILSTAFLGMLCTDLDTLVSTFSLCAISTQRKGADSVSLALGWNELNSVIFYPFSPHFFYEVVHSASCSAKIRHVIFHFFFIFGRIIALNFV